MDKRLAALPWGAPVNFLGLPDPAPTLERAPIVILPVPYESTVSYMGGTRFGPRRILEASRYIELYDHELDGEFHALIGRASANRVLQLAREPSDLLVRPTTELVLRKVKEGAPRLLHAHRMYLDALRRRDKDAGRLWVRRHINDWRKGFERAGNDLDQPIDKIYLRSLTKEETAAD